MGAGKDLNGVCTWWRAYCVSALVLRMQRGEIALSLQSALYWDKHSATNSTYPLGSQLLGERLQSGEGKKVPPAP